MKPNRNAEPSYRAPEVCRLAGITYRKLDYWTRVGYMNASIADGGGSGSQRLYSRADVRTARVLGRLSNLGVLHRWDGDPGGTVQDLIDKLEAAREEYEQEPLEQMAAV